MGNLANYFQNINWSKPTWDLMVIIIFLAVSVLYGLSVGRNRLVVTIVSTYMALAVVTFVPFTSLKWTAPYFSSPTMRVILFLGIFIILFFLLSRSALIGSISSDIGGGWWQVIIFGFLQIGLLINIIFSYLPPGALSHFSDPLKFYFISDIATTFWICAPIALLILVRKRVG